MFVAVETFVVFAATIDIGIGCTVGNGSGLAVTVGTLVWVGVASSANATWPSIISGSPLSLPQASDTMATDETNTRSKRESNLVFASDVTQQTLDKYRVSKKNYYALSQSITRN